MDDDGLVLAVWRCGGGGCGVTGLQVAVMVVTVVQDQVPVPLHTGEVMMVVVQLQRCEMQTL